MKKTYLNHSTRKNILWIFKKMTKYNYTKNVKNGKQNKYLMYIKEQARENSMS